MYKHYFGLQDSPFSIAPNPQYLYMSTRHREALAHLLYGVKSDGGFILLTGEVGTGKTTVCRCLLAQIPTDVDIAMVLNPKQTAVELLATICDELHITYNPNASIKILVDRLNVFLLDSHRAGRKTILIIDEAQNLEVDVLEQLRLLTNLETNQRKLLQIILLGQPELLTLLGRQELRQLSQRVTARFHLDALNQQEVGEYIQHRLTVAGGNQTLFPPTSIRRIYQITAGIPRLINLVCDRALLGAYVENQPRVNNAIVAKAAREVLGHSGQRSRLSEWWKSIVLLLALLLSLGVVINSEPVKKRLWPTSPVQTELLSAPVEVQPALTATISPVAVRRQLLSLVTSHKDLEQALHDLLSSWDSLNSIAVTSNVCSSLLDLGLNCFETKSDLTEIRQMNRPIALNLGDSTSPRWVTLKKIYAEELLLQIGTSEVLVSSQELVAAGSLNSIVIWRSPPGYLQPLKLGDSGSTVDLLVNTLNRVEYGDPTEEIGFLFDLNLEQRIKAFQLASGIEPDGLVGPRTWIQLNNISGTDIPVLEAGVDD
jgi:general secretion pathway protein A